VGFFWEVLIRGHSISDRYVVVFRRVVRLGLAVRPLRWRQSMTALYVIAGVLALVLLIYLFVALLKPEAFE
jgi:K+-transporting ATPase KdpF subunit